MYCTHVHVLYIRVPAVITNCHLFSVIERLMCGKAVFVGPWGGALVLVTIGFNDKLCGSLKSSLGVE